MQIQGTVVTVELGIEIKKQAGGVYQGSRLSYRDEAGVLREQCFTAQTLKYNPVVKVALSNLAPGESFIMVKEKEGEYWNVKSIVTGVAELQKTTGEVSKGTGVSSKGFSSPKSTYETPEERAKKQVYIVRQSSLSAAINLLAANGGKKNSVEEVIQTAKQFESYVFDTGSNGVDAIIQMEDDIA